MKRLVIDSVPPALYQDLADAAAMNQRTIEAEVLFRLTEMLKREKKVEAILERVREGRARSPKIWLTDESIEAAINEGRE